MALGLYINFKDSSKQAITFYEKVFNTKCTDMMLFKDAPYEGMTMTDQEGNMVMNASLTIQDMIVMFSDTPSFAPGSLSVGNNITLVLQYDDDKAIEQAFALLSENGQILLNLTQTFWSKKYGMLVDQFGIGWQLNLRS